MAQVDNAISRDIDKLLTFLMAQWERLPQVAAEIDGWHPLERIDFIEEWPLEEDRLARLEQYVAQGALTPEQLVCYERLKHLVAQNRPIIRRLQES